MRWREFLTKIRTALTEGAQVAATGKLSFPITAIYNPSHRAFKLKVGSADESRDIGRAACCAESSAPPSNLHTAANHPWQPRFAQRGAGS
jgi:hypothetical protein